MNDKSHVYLLLDPLVESTVWQDRVFYVGKGTGTRALSHELETGESAKIERIRAIKESGKSYEILYATWTDQVDVNSTLMSEKEAFQLEAALIESLRPQLAN
ncbi:MAG: GIY-YIG nuclease family protein, partial [Thermomicrobiales bacterium]|nr:GIY-YIG nuclease family protein [Thermomicrobiales bacterium]